MREINSIELSLVAGGQEKSYLDKANEAKDKIVNLAQNNLDVIAGFLTAAGLVVICHYGYRFIEARAHRYD